MGRRKAADKVGQPLTQTERRQNAKNDQKTMEAFAENIWNMVESGKNRRLRLSCERLYGLTPRKAAEVTVLPEESAAVVPPASPTTETAEAAAAQAVSQQAEVAKASSQLDKPEKPDKRDSKAQKKQKRLKEAHTKQYVEKEVSSNQERLEKVSGVEPEQEDSKRETNELGASSAQLVVSETTDSKTEVPGSSLGDHSEIPESSLKKPEEETAFSPHPEEFNETVMSEERHQEGVLDLNKSDTPAASKQANEEDEMFTKQGEIPEAFGLQPVILEHPKTPSEVSEKASADGEAAEVIETLDTTDVQTPSSQHIDVSEPVPEQARIDIPEEPKPLETVTERSDAVASLLEQPEGTYTPVEPSEIDPAYEEQAESVDVAQKEAETTNDTCFNQDNFQEMFASKTDMEHTSNNEAKETAGALSQDNEQLKPSGDTQLPDEQAKKAKSHSLTNGSMTELHEDTQPDTVTESTAHSEVANKSNIPTSELERSDSQKLMFSSWMEGAEAQASGAEKTEYTEENIPSDLGDFVGLSSETNPISTQEVSIKPEQGEPEPPQLEDRGYPTCCSEVELGYTALLPEETAPQKAKLSLEVKRDEKSQENKQVEEPLSSPALVKAVLQSAIPAIESKPTQKGKSEKKQKRHKGKRKELEIDAEKATSYESNIPGEASGSFGKVSPALTSDPSQTATEGLADAEPEAEAPLTGVNGDFLTTDQTPGQEAVEKAGPTVETKRKKRKRRRSERKSESEQNTDVVVKNETTSVTKTSINGDHPAVSEPSDIIEEPSVDAAEVWTTVQSKKTKKNRKRSGRKSESEQKTHATDADQSSATQVSGAPEEASAETPAPHCSEKDTNAVGDMILSNIEGAMTPGDSQPPKESREDTTLDAFDLLLSPGDDLAEGFHGAFDEDKNPDQQAEAAVALDAVQTGTDKSTQETQSAACEPKPDRHYERHEEKESLVETDNAGMLQTMPNTPALDVAESETIEKAVTELPKSSDEADAFDLLMSDKDGLEEGFRDSFADDEVKEMGTDPGVDKPISDLCAAAADAENSSFEKPASESETPREQVFTADPLAEITPVTTSKGKQASRENGSKSQEQLAREAHTKLDTPITTHNDPQMGAEDALTAEKGSRTADPVIDNVASDAFDLLMSAADGLEEGFNEAFTEENEPLAKATPDPTTMHLTVAADGAQISSSKVPPPENEVPHQTLDTVQSQSIIKKENATDSGDNQVSGGGDDSNPAFAPNDNARETDIGTGNTAEEVDAFDLLMSCGEGLEEGFRDAFTEDEETGKTLHSPASKALELPPSVDQAPEDPPESLVSDEALHQASADLNKNSEFSSEPFATPAMEHDPVSKTPDKRETGESSAGQDAFDLLMSAGDGLEEGFKGAFAEDGTEEEPSFPTDGGDDNKRQTGESSAGQDAFDLLMSAGDGLEEGFQDAFAEEGAEEEPSFPTDGGDDNKRQTGESSAGQDAFDLLMSAGDGLEEGFQDAFAEDGTGEEKIPECAFDVSAISANIDDNEDAAQLESVPEVDSQKIASDVSKDADPCIKSSDITPMAVLAQKNDTQSLQGQSEVGKEDNRLEEKEHIVTKEESWFDKSLHDKAETKFYEQLSRVEKPVSEEAKQEPSSASSETLVSVPVSTSPSEPFKQFSPQPASEVEDASKGSWWFDKSAYDQAEAKYHEKLACVQQTETKQPEPASTSLQADESVMAQVPVAANQPVPQPAPPVGFASEGNTWFDKSLYDTAETHFYERLSRQSESQTPAVTRQLSGASGSSSQGMYDASCDHFEADEEGAVAEDDITLCDDVLPDETTWTDNKLYKVSEGSPSSPEAPTASVSISTTPPLPSQMTINTQAVTSTPTSAAQASSLASATADNNQLSPTASNSTRSRRSTFNSAVSPQSPTLELDDQYFEDVVLAERQSEVTMAALRGFTASPLSEGLAPGEQLDSLQTEPDMELSEPGTADILDDENGHGPFSYDSVTSVGSSVAGSQTPVANGVRSLSIASPSLDIGVPPMALDAEVTSPQVAEMLFSTRLYGEAAATRQNEKASPADKDATISTQDTEATSLQPTETLSTIETEVPNTAFLVEVKPSPPADAPSPLDKAVTPPQPIQELPAADIDATAAMPEVKPASPKSLDNFSELHTETASAPRTEKLPSPELKMGRTPPLEVKRLPSPELDIELRSPQLDERLPSPELGAEMPAVTLPTDLPSPTLSSGIAVPTLEANLPTPSMTAEIPHVPLTTSQSPAAADAGGSSPAVTLISDPVKPPVGGTLQSEPIHSSEEMVRRQDWDGQQEVPESAKDGRSQFLENQQQQVDDKNKFSPTGNEKLSPKESDEEANSFARQKAPRSPVVTKKLNRKKRSKYTGSKTTGLQEKDLPPKSAKHSNISLDLDICKSGSESTICASPASSIQDSAEALSPNEPTEFTAPVILNEKSDIKSITTPEPGSSSTESAIAPAAVSKSAVDIVPQSPTVAEKSIEKKSKPDNITKAPEAPKPEPKTAAVITKTPPTTGGSSPPAATARSSAPATSRPILPDRTLFLPEDAGRTYASLMQQGGDMLPARPVFTAHACHVCKRLHTKQHRLKSCGSCRLVAYCSPEHQRAHWPLHRALCKVVTRRLRHLGTDHLYREAVNVASAEQWKKIRFKHMAVCEEMLDRPMEPYEKEMFLYPRACDTCHETSPERLHTCTACHSISYCREDHLRKNHAKFCKDLRLLLDIHAYQNQHGVCDPVLPDTQITRYEPLPPHIREFLVVSMLGPQKAFQMGAVELAVLTEYASYPLTMLYALENIPVTAEAHISQLTELTVHVVGAEFNTECDPITRWEVFLLNVLPRLRRLHMVFVGPELEIGGRPGVSAEDFTCTPCRAAGKRFTCEFQPNTAYHNYFRSPQYRPPNVICAFNAGLHKYAGHETRDTWKPSLPCLVQDSVPLILTGYNLLECPQDVARIQQEQKVDVLLPPMKNPYRSTRPQQNFLNEHEAPVVFKNQYVACLMAASRSRK